MTATVLARVAQRASGLAAGVATWLLEPEPPLLGIEVHASAIAALRLSGGGGQRALAAASTIALSEGTLQLAMAKTNIADPAAFKGALHQVIERVGGLTERRVALTLPDSVARIVILGDGGVAAGRALATAEVVRFRLRDKVPFDIRSAAVAWEQIPAAPDGAPGALIAVAVLRSVIEEYEGVLASLGLTPGLVEISGLALLRSLARPAASGDWLTLNWDEDHFSLFLTRRSVPLLARTVLGRIDPESVGRELSNTILYHSERLGGQGLAGARLRAIPLPAAEALEHVEKVLGVTPTLIDPLAELGGAAMAELGQGLAGVACALRLGSR